MLIAIGFLPALLRLRRTRGSTSCSVPGSARATSPTHGVWFRWSREIQKRPWASSVGSRSPRCSCSAIPYFDMRLGSSDAGNGPTSLHTRRAYDLLAEGFGPGFNGPLLVTARA